MKQEKIKEEQEKLKQKRRYNIDNNLPSEELKNIRKNLWLHNTLYKVMSLFNFISGYEKDFERKLYDFNERPIIFAFNHVRMQDIAIEMEAIKNHMVLLSGDFENVHPDISGKLLEKNGIIYFDMKNPYDSPELEEQRKYLEELNSYLKEDLREILKEEYYKILKEEYDRVKNEYENRLKLLINDRHNVKTVINDVLQAGYNMLWYYEGSWNLSENKPYYDGYNYMVEAALKNNAIVVPGAFDLIEDEKSKKRRAVIRFADPIDYSKMYDINTLTKEEKNEGLDLIKGQIGRLLFDIWNEYSNVSRKELEEKYKTKLSAKEYFTPDYKRKSPLIKCFEEYMDKVLSEWKFSLEQIEEKHFVDKNIVKQSKAFEHLDNLDLNKDNAFLLSKRNHH